MIQLPNQKLGILTNHHVVHAHQQIYGKSNNAIMQYELKPLWLSHELDLALLTIKNDDEHDDFFNSIEPMILGDIPPLQSTITLLGYPIGGTSLSVTEGILSRLEYTGYTLSHLPFLAAQVDAAMNSGNSGGPAVSNGCLLDYPFKC